MDGDASRSLLTRRVFSKPSLRGAACLRSDDGKPCPWLGSAHRVMRCGCRGAALGGCFQQPPTSSSSSTSRGRAGAQPRDTSHRNLLTQCAANTEMRTRPCSCQSTDHHRQLECQLKLRDRLGRVWGWRPGVLIDEKKKSARGNEAARTIGVSPQPIQFPVFVRVRRYFPNASLLLLNITLP